MTTDPIGPWNCGRSFEDADFAFAVAAWTRLHSGMIDAYEEDGGLSEALRIGELLSAMMAEAVSILEDPNHPAWLLPRDNNSYQEGDL